MRMFRYTIPAGGSQSIHHAGNFIRGISGDARYELQIDEGQAIQFETGLAYTAPESFRQVRVVNTSDSAQTIEVAIASTRIEDNRLIAIQPVTLKPAGGIQALPEVNGDGTIAANADRRELLLRADIANQGNVYMGGVPLYPGDTMTLDVTGAVAVTADNAYLAGDEHYGSVEALLHFDDPGTTFTDTEGNTWTAFNGAEIVSDAEAIGGAHGAFVSTNDDYIEMTGGVDHQIDGEFCIEFNITPSVADPGVYWFTYTDGSNHIWLYADSNGEFVFLVFNNQVPGSQAITPGQRYHIAITRDAADQVRCFVDGVEVAGATSLAGGAGASQTIQLGGAPAVAGSGKGGRCHIDEFRLTVGEARYTANFTPSEEPHPERVTAVDGDRLHVAEVV